jgi:hypothetical protein
VLRHTNTSPPARRNGPPSPRKRGPFLCAGRGLVQGRTVRERDVALVLDVDGAVCSWPRLSGVM